MDTIGNEVGQKMRSAIKAKLMELGCYVDDELPDYIMVMVANKRTRTQMDSDLQLFLRTNTKVFVDWLQQVLKKLKEVRITNPEVYACSSIGELKRKATLEISECVIKKEKKEKKIKAEKKDSAEPGTPKLKSLSDDIPVTATKLVEKRNIKSRLGEEILERPDQILQNSSLSIQNVVNEDNFDIPSLSEVNLLADSELDLVEDKIKKVRSRLVLMNSDSEDEDFINIKADAEELLGNELCDISSSTNLNMECNKQPEKIRKKVISLKRHNSDIPSVSTNVTESIHRAPEDLRFTISNMKTSILERLGKRPTENADHNKSNNTTSNRKTKISLAEILREEKEISGKIISSVVHKPAVRKEPPQKRENVHKRLGVPSSVVALPKKTEIIQRPIERPNKVLPSVVKVKPRRPVSGLCQANKNLLLKAVAEAQRSVSQIPPTRTENKGALFTKKYREQHKMEPERRKKSPKQNAENENVPKIQKQNIIVQVTSNKSESNDEILDESNLESTAKDDSEKSVELECVPSAIDLTFDDDLDKYIEDLESINGSNSREPSEEKEIEETTTNHQFIVTLDGLKNKPTSKKEESSSPTSTTNIGELPIHAKRHPSPIIFSKKEIKEAIKPVCKIPETLPKVCASISIKTKERCKYWPGCRLGDLCEYIHPNTPCKLFPLCKFGDRCLYIHPKCKFYASCTRKDCPYSHGVKTASKIVSKVSVPYHVVPQVLTQEICKYFPNCTNVNCHFIHPRPCRFGTNCLNKAECSFSHSNVPSKEKLTWHSNIR